MRDAGHIWSVKSVVNSRTFIVKLPPVVERKFYRLDIEVNRQLCNQPPLLSAIPLNEALQLLKGEAAKHPHAPFEFNLNEARFKLTMTSGLFVAQIYPAPHSNGFKFRGLATFDGGVVMATEPDKNNTFISVARAMVKFQAHMSAQEAMAIHEKIIGSNLY
jgi:hypothetical protein